MKRILTLIILAIGLLLSSCKPAKGLPVTKSPAQEISSASTAVPTPIPSYTQGSIEPGQQSAFSFQSSSGEVIRYYLYLPEGYDGEQHWPVIISLHGFLGFNYTLESLQKQTPVAWIGENTDFPFILISPMGPDGLWSEYHEPMEELLATLDGSLSINEEAVFLTGLSAGGTGVWQWVLAYPHRFAGAAIVAGSPSFHSSDDLPEDICLLKDLPLWIAYSDEDLGDSINSTNSAIAALKDCGSTSIQLTTYTGISHMESISTAYSGSELYQWMLAQIDR